jgi:translation initiation factor 5A
MTSTVSGIDSASAGLPVNRAEIDQANKKIVEFAGPIKITGIKKGHEIKPRDIVMITGQPCQVKSTRFLSPTGKLVITGGATIPIPEEAEYRKQRANPTFAMEVDALDEIQIPEVKFIFISQFQTGEHLPINNRPCKIIDFNISKCACHSGDKVHVIGVDIFTGKQKEALVS